MLVSPTTVFETRAVQLVASICFDCAIPGTQNLGNLQVFLTECRQYIITGSFRIHTRLTQSTGKNVLVLGALELTDSNLGQITGQLN